MRKDSRREGKGSKIKEAAALRYSPEKNIAPEIIALGKGEFAGEILKKAKESGVPVYKDDSLAHTLNQLKIGNEIPAELYGIVAEILVFVSNIDRDFGESNGRDYVGSNNRDYGGRDGRE